MLQPQNVADPAALLRSVRRVSAIRDILIAAGLAAICYLLAMEFDFSDRIGEWTKAWGRGERYDVFFALLVLTICLAAFIYRRSRELERLQGALRALAIQWQAVFDSVGNPICLADTEGRVQLCNHAITQLTDKSVADCIGRHFSTIIHSTTDTPSDDLLAQLHQSRQRQNAVLNLVDRTLEVTADPMLDARGELVGVIYVLNDITERKRAEEKLRESDERLRQSEKMTAIGQLAGGVAHDFNNQLTGVLGYADLLCSRLDDPALKRYAESIRTGAQCSADLIGKLLAFARKGQYQSVPVDMNRVINEAVDVLERSIDKRIRIEQLLRAMPTVVTGDPSQIENAILNLALNARDAMPDGGTLTVETQVVHLDAELYAKPPYELRVGDYLMLTVTDTGCGMSDEVKRHLFEPFFTTKPVGKGTGMGLAAVYGTVKSHHGATTVSSEVGRGTSFRIYLPLAAPAEETVNESAGPEARRCAKLRVLVVDDMVLVRELAAEILRSEGHEVLVAADGRAGIELYRAQWQGIDLVVLDMAMPHLGGRDTFRAMKAINPRIRAGVIRSS